LTQTHDYDDSPMFLVWAVSSIFCLFRNISAFENVAYGYSKNCTNQVFSHICGSQIRRAVRKHLVLAVEIGARKLCYTGLHKSDVSSLTVSLDRGAKLPDHMSPG